MRKGIWLLVVLQSLFGGVSAQEQGRELLILLPFSETTANSDRAKLSELVAELVEQVGPIESRGSAVVLNPSVSAFQPEAFKREFVGDDFEFVAPSNSQDVETDSFQPTCTGDFTDLTSINSLLQSGVVQNGLDVDIKLDQQTLRVFDTGMPSETREIAGSGSRAPLDLTDCFNLGTLYNSNLRPSDLGSATEIFNRLGPVDISSVVETAQAATEPIVANGLEFTYSYQRNKLVIGLDASRETSPTCPFILGSVRLERALTSEEIEILELYKNSRFMETDPKTAPGLDSPVSATTSAISVRDITDIVADYGLPGVTGASNVLVAIIDTGIDPHVASDIGVPLGMSLAGTVVSASENKFVSATQIDGRLSDDGIIQQNSRMKGHGTFLAQIVHQVAPDAVLMPIKACGSIDGHPSGYGCTFFNVMKGVCYALDRAKSTGQRLVINVSLGVDDNVQEFPLLANLLSEAAKNGATIVTSAGNHKSYKDVNCQGPKRNSKPVPLHYPAAYGVMKLDSDLWESFKIDTTSVLAVGALDQALTGLADYSYTANLYAPGTCINVSGGSDGGYFGTSFAAAFVSGVVAQLYAKDAGAALSPEAIKSCLISRGNKLENFGQLACTP